MKKSLKILFTALLVGLAVVMTSCGAVIAVTTQVTYMKDKTYSTTILSQSVRLKFTNDQVEGSSKYVLYLYVNDTLHTGYAWYPDLGEAVAEKKDVLIYKTTALDEPIGRLRPNSLTPDYFTVVDDSIWFSSVPVLIAKDQVFTRIDN